MKLRKISQKEIILSLIYASKADINIKTSLLESHYLAGGNVVKVMQAMIYAKKAGLALSFEQAAKIDLAGNNVLEEVKKFTPTK